MGATSIWTAAHYGIPLLLIVANNRSYYNDEVHQERVARMRERPVENKWIGQRIEGLDISAIARAQGFAAPGPVSSETDFVKALSDAAQVVRGGGRALVEVIVEGGYEEK